MTNILDRLARHPELQKRVEGILEILESSGSDLRRADEAERQITKQVRQLGHEALSGWAEGRVAEEAKRLEQSEDWRRAGEKNSTGIAPTV